jgi:hypothetical protein
MSESILWCFAISKKRVSTLKYCYKKAVDRDEPANRYEPESHGDVSLIQTDEGLDYQTNTSLPHRHFLSRVK